MQVLNTGTTYRIYDSSMKAYDQLPPAVYKINFNPMAGYSLTIADDIEINEKIYGKHLEKVDKVYNAFKVFPRNLGVILSGDKGIGKSLFAKLLSIKAVENGYPIILCDSPYPGIADFLGSIQQEIVVLFDEFDKTFAGHEGGDPQADLLTLFDGLYMGKKLFIITCNDIHKLNDYLVNRPGRFHYHFRFDYPTGDEVREYLTDHVEEKFWDEISAVVNFANKVKLNYDCLRAIAFELNMGVSFAEAAADLNIVNVERVYYDLILYCKDGSVYKRTDECLDIFSNESECLWMRNSKKSGEPSINIEFTPSDNVYDYSRGMIIPGSDISATWDKEGYYGDDAKDMAVIMEQRLQDIDFMLLKRNFQNANIHYTV